MNRIKNAAYLLRELQAPEEYEGHHQVVNAELELLFLSEEEFDLALEYSLGGIPQGDIPEQTSVEPLDEDDLPF